MIDATFPWRWPPAGYALIHVATHCLCSGFSATHMPDGQAHWSRRFLRFIPCMWIVAWRLTQRYLIHIFGLVADRLRALCRGALERPVRVDCRTLALD